MCFWTSLEVQWTRIPPTNAGYMGWIPAQGRLHATEKLSLCATTTEPTCHNYWSLLAKSPGSTTREATTERNAHSTAKNRPHPWQLEKSLCSNKDPAQPKVNKLNKTMKKQL